MLLKLGTPNFGEAGGAHWTSAQSLIWTLERIPLTQVANCAGSYNSCNAFQGDDAAWVSYP